MRLRCDSNATTMRPDNYDIVKMAKDEKAGIRYRYLSFLLQKIGDGVMPRKPKKPCAYPGCPNLCEGRYCPEHQTKVNSEYEKYGRDPRTKKRYGRAWKRIRDKYVMEHPFCELCFQRGIMVETEEVHHKKPLSEGGTHDRSNLIALCKSCHSRIHANRGDRWHNKTAAP